MLSRLAISSSLLHSLPLASFFKGRRLLFWPFDYTCFVFHSHSWLYRIVSNHHAHRHTHLITGTKDTFSSSFITFLLLFDPCLRLHPSIAISLTHTTTHTGVRLDKTPQKPWQNFVQQHGPCDLASPGECMCMCI